MSDNTEPRGVTAGEHVLAAHLQDEAVLLDMDSKNYYQLNTTAAAVWAGIERGLDRDGLIAELCANFEVDEETAAASLDALLQDLRDRGLIRTGDTPPTG